MSPPSQHLSPTPAYSRRPVMTSLSMHTAHTPKLSTIPPVCSIPLPLILSCAPPSVHPPIHRVLRRLCPLYTSAVPSSHPSCTAAFVCYVRPPTAIIPHDPPIHSLPNSNRSDVTPLSALTPHSYRPLHAASIGVVLRSAAALSDVCTAVFVYCTCPVLTNHHQLGPSKREAPPITE
jgi:hypothetical protein